jgi:hypothetical protein
MKRILGLLLSVTPLMLIGCGGVTNSVSPGPVSTAGQAQGVYSGTASSGSSFDSIVLPNDKFYALYGTINGTVFVVNGMITGQGTSNSGTYTASVTDFNSTGATLSGSVTASYVTGSSLSGTVNENGTMLTFTGTSLPVSFFNFNTPASLSAITGMWTGTLLDGTAATITINADGTFSGSNLECLLSGTITPDSSNKNFFNVSLTFGGSPCLLANQTESGIAIDSLLPNGITRQLLAGVSSATSGTVFAAQR